MLMMNISGNLQQCCMILHNSGLNWLQTPAMCIVLKTFSFNLECLVPDTNSFFAPVSQSIHCLRQKQDVACIYQHKLRKWWWLILVSNCFCGDFLSEMVSLHWRKYISHVEIKIRTSEEKRCDKSLMTGASNRTSFPDHILKHGKRKLTLYNF